VPEEAEVYGKSIVPLLRGDDAEWPDRVIVTDSQRVEHPIKWRKSATMTDRWRLVNGTELYDITADPEQRTDIAEQHPGVVERLRAEYEAWWKLVSRRFDEYIPVVVGTEHEPETDLTGHDWHGDANPWSHGHIRSGMACNGFWAIDAAEAGAYEFELRRWPKELDHPITAGLPGKVVDWFTGGEALPLTEARIRVGDEERAKPIPPGAKGVAFTFDLPAGETRLQTWLTDGAELSLGAYYVYVRRVG